MLICHDEKRRAMRPYKIAAGTRIVYFPPKGTLWFENSRGKSIEVDSESFDTSEFYLWGFTDHSQADTLIRFIAALFGCNPERQEDAAGDGCIRYVLVREKK